MLAMTALWRQSEFAQCTHSQGALRRICSNVGGASMRPKPTPLGSMRSRQEWLWGSARSASIERSGNTEADEVETVDG